MKTGGVT